MEITQIHDHNPDPNMPRGVDRVAAADPFPLAPIWRRVLAAVIDVLLLSGVSFALALPLRRAFYWLGPWGRLIGLAFGITYFGLTISHRMGGQSLGMRLVKIGVVTRSGLPPDTPQSFGRAAVLCIIVLGNAWVLPIPILSTVLSTISAIGIALLIYGFFFNRSTRQGPHDLLFQTYVVRLPIYDQQPPRFSAVYRAGLIGCGGLALVIALSIALLGSQLLGAFAPGTVEVLRPLQTALSTDPRIFSVGVQSAISRRLTPGGRGEVARTILIDVWSRPCGVIEAELCATIAADVARLAIQENVLPAGVDNLVININHRADLGWAILTATSTYAHPIESWRGIIGSP